MAHQSLRLDGSLVSPSVGIDWALPRCAWPSGPALSRRNNCDARHYAWYVLGVLVRAAFHDFQIEDFQVGLNHQY